MNQNESQNIEYKKSHVRRNTRDAILEKDFQEEC